jgi:hypothetical protein
MMCRKTCHIGARHLSHHFPKHLQIRTIKTLARIVLGSTVDSNNQARGMRKPRKTRNSKIKPGGKMKTTHALFITSVLLTMAGTTHAAFYDRGNGMIYDSIKNITWLQDANYAKTSGYDTDGRMTWSAATAWADGLTYGGYSDWRLASARLMGDDSYSRNGSTDLGYLNSRSEIGYLFLALNNLPSTFCPFSGPPVVCLPTDNPGLQNTTFIDAATGLSVSFLNAKNDVYWEAETYSKNSAQAWMYGANGVNSGLQTYGNKTSSLYAWAVRDGDVAAVPVPAAAWLFGSGLITLAGAARRKSNT